MNKNFGIALGTLGALTALGAAAAALTFRINFKREKKAGKNTATFFAKLEKKLGQRVALECVVDPQILGGAIIETENTVIDGSLKRKIQEVKEVINSEPKAP